MSDHDQSGALSANPVSQNAGVQAGAVERVAGIPRSLLKEVWSLALLLAAVFVVRSSIFSIYVIPTGSMLPTIKIDDRVFANKLAFGLMLPFGERQVISWSSPKRGDIVLFKSPMEDQTFVKRVVGIGGDELSFEAGVLKINGELAHEELQSDRSVMEDMGGGEAAESRNLLRERVLDKPEHYVLRSRTGGVTLYESRTFRVPEGKIFLMGDNRDGSNDSRSWGVIDAASVYGRASFVLYSTERTEDFLPKFRTDRFFKSFD